MIDKLALALRELKGSPDTFAAGWNDAEEAAELRAILLRLGAALVPTEVTEPIRRAVWLAQYEHNRDTRYPNASADVIAELTASRVNDPDQREQDAIAWRAGIAAAELELRGDG